MSEERVIPPAAAVTRAPATADPAPSLGAFDVGCVVIGGIIGVGIFFTPQKVAERVDNADLVIAAWAIGGALAVLGALVFASLSTLVPGHGGIFRYIHAAFGRWPAFLYGWANWLVIQAGALGVVALILVGNLDVLLFREPRLSPDAQVGIAAAAMLLFTITNVVGLQVGKRVQNLLTVMKVLALLFLVVLSWCTAARPAEAPPPPTGKSVAAQLSSALLPVLFAIGGWQQGSFLAGAVRRPSRNLPLGILGGVAIVIVTYITVNLAYLDLLGFEAARRSGAIGTDAARAGLGDAGGRVLAGMVVISAAGIMNTICMAPPYVLLAMAREGLFPAAFGRLHARFGTPLLGVLGQGLWAVVLLFGVHLFARGADQTTDTLGFVCDGVVFVDWLFFTLCGAALLRLRRKAGPGAFRLPGGGLVAALFAAGALAVTIGALAEQRQASLTGVAIVAVGLVLYVTCMRGRSAAASRSG
jgi:APA family basic amino acid/polyamine antiporter